MWFSGCCWGGDSGDAASSSVVGRLTRAARMRIAGRRDGSFDVGTGEQNKETGRQLAAFPFLGGRGRRGRSAENRFWPCDMHVVSAFWRCWRCWLKAKLHD